jgi:hypothetical protein
MILGDQHLYDLAGGFGVYSAPEGWYRLKSNTLADTDIAGCGHCQAATE